MIKIWRYKDAPEHIRRLRLGASDPDWVAEAPAEEVAEIESFFQSRRASIGAVLRREQPGGTVLFFGQDARGAALSDSKKGKASGAT